MNSESRLHQETSLSISPFADIASLLRHHGSSRPDAVAIPSPDRQQLSYGNLLDLTHHVRDRLNGWGIGRGDCVPCVIKDNAATVTAFLTVSACACFGSVPLHWIKSDYETYLDHLQPRAVIVEAGLDIPLRAAARSRNITVIDLVIDDAAAGLFTLGGGENSPCARPGWVEPGDDMIILPSSGTTAEPKLIAWQQKAFLTACHAKAKHCGLLPSDRCFLLYPTDLSASLGGTILPAIIAGGSVFPGAPFEIGRFFRQLAELRASWISAPPTVLQALIPHLDEFQESIARSTIAALKSGDLSALESAFDAPHMEAFSTSEVFHIAANHLPPGERRPGTVGKPLNGEVAIHANETFVTDPDVTGEIVVRGAYQFDRYVNDPAATEAAYVDGWYRTGDLGRFDADGFLYITGRLKEQINCGGMKVAPREVEKTLEQHEAVSEAGVCGVPHPTLRELVVAAVALKEGEHATEASLQKYARSHLAMYKAPRRIVIVDKIPRDGQGKIARGELREILDAHRLARRAIGPPNMPAM